MAHGERASTLTNNCGKDYWKKRGFLSRCWGWMSGVSHRSGTNKLTKRYTNKSERMQVKKFIKNKDFNDL
jgi:hypothetical protein